MHYNLLLSDINCQVFTYSVNLEVLRLHKRWIGLSGRSQEGVFGTNIVYFTCIVLQTYFSVGEKENRKLKNEVDALEQYGRRSLIRISGIPEPTEEGYSGFCFRFFPHFKILNLTPGSDKRTIIWRCLTTAAAFSSGLPTMDDQGKNEFEGQYR
jgi:hypothetical protein